MRRGDGLPGTEQVPDPPEGAGVAGVVLTDPWLETLFASAPVAVAFLDRNLRYLRVSDRLAQLNGVPVAEHVGQTIFEVVPDLAGDAAPLLRQVMDTGEALVGVELAGQSAAQPGVARTWREDVYPVRDDRGWVCGVAVVVEDVSVLRRAEAEARWMARWDSEWGYNRGLIEASVDGLLTVDVDGNISDVNNRMCEMTGRARSELLGTAFAGYFTDPDRARAGVRQTFQDGVVTGYALTLLSRTGPSTPVSFNASVFRDPVGEVQGVFASARDISERVRLEQRLREQQMYLRGLIEASIDGLVTVDPDLVVTDVNERICRMTGRSRDELIGSRFDRYFTDPAAAAAGVERTLRDGSVADYELELVAGGGEPAVVSFNAARFADPAGAVQGVFAAARDVTERKRAEAALAQASERERVRAEQAAIFATFAEELATLDPAPGGVLDRVTVQVADFLGDTCGVFVVGDDGKTLRNLAWHSREPEAVEFARRLLASRPYTTETGPAGELFRTGRTVVFGEADATSLREQIPAEYRPFLDRFGAVSTVYVPLRAAGTTFGVIVAYRFAGHPAYTDDEITFLEEFGARASLGYENARQRADRKRSQELLDAVFQTLPDLICIAGNDGYFRVLNPAWEHTLGWTIAELCAQPYVEFVHPDDRRQTLAEHDRQTQRGEEVISFENRYRCRDGSYRWLQWNSLPLAERDILVANARDVTERKQAEEALAQSHHELERRSAELERSNRDLEQFAYVASHDLQEPLRMVSSYTTLLAEDLGDRLDDNARRHLDYAHDGAIRMQQLVSDLLRYARVSRGTATSRERVDCDQLVETVTVDLHEAIVTAGATVTHDRLPTVTGVATELRQLFANLIGNAVKFHGDAPVHVHVDAERTEATWRFSVADNGIGIDPAQTERIFEVFKRLHSRRRYPGTGIGLAICKKVVEHHGGRIWVESHPGAGSTFWFTLSADPNQRGIHEPNR